MSKPISNAAYRKMIVSMPADEQMESISRMLRVVPQLITYELVTTNNDKVLKKLESRLRQVRLMSSEYYANGRIA